MKTIKGNIVDLHNETVFPGAVHIVEGVIAGIERERYWHDSYIIPGFVDAHVHIESSMLTPAEFARLAVVQGTVATVSDPHEIANVLGPDGVHYMMENGADVSFTFVFGAPSCVPASPFETSGAVIGADQTGELLGDARIGYLSEVMNFPGVIGGDREVLAKIELARRLGKPVDGHAPGLRGQKLRKYAAAGISTDHESFDIEEAREKISFGMKVQIREGSAARNLDALCPLIAEYPDHCMFCSDDKHPDDLVRGHINVLAARAVRAGMDVMKVLRCACLNPVLHYGLDVGLLRKGDAADMVVVNNLEELVVLKTLVRGKTVAENGETCLVHRPAAPMNVFRANPKRPADFLVRKRSALMRVIEVIEGQLITGGSLEAPIFEGDAAVCDASRDILKVTVVNRYADAPPAVGFIRGFGLKNGAIASSVAHDSHNIIAVGVSDEMICDAVNLVIEKKGGISLVSDETKTVLPLPVAGIMSDGDGWDVAVKYSRLNVLAKELGTTLRAPFMTLSFMALLVIPKLKLSDRGLFDGENFTFTDLFAE
ncbi:MAG TPA: adenine deaminase [Syntrophorhabdaceae bacterium]|nr:adenine deaminase [Syntrophorhabdaceae bacterium]